MGTPSQNQIKDLIKQVGRDLIKTFGKKKCFRPKEVRAACKKFNYNEFYCWSLCFFTDRNSFDNDHASNGKICEYLGMKTKVISVITDGKSNSWKNFDYNLSWLELPEFDYASFFELPDFNALSGG